MNKIIFSLLLMPLLAFTSCIKQGSAVINIQVRSNGESVGAGTAVYMFDTEFADHYGLDSKFSVRNELTNAEGIAIFYLVPDEIDKLNIKSTYKFVVYKGDDEKNPIFTSVSVQKDNTEVGIIEL